MAMRPKAIYTLSEIPIKIPMAFFKGLEQIISKFVWKQKSIVQVHCFLIDILSE